MELTEWKEKALDTVKGDLALTKLDFCLIGAICFLAGVCIGMIAAPLTHGISLFSHNSHNGSENGNNCGNQYRDGEEGGDV